MQITGAKIILVIIIIILLYMLAGKCCALTNQRLEILGSHCLDYEDLALLHWRSLLRLAKASKRF